MRCLLADCLCRSYRNDECKQKENESKPYLDLRECWIVWFKLKDMAKVNEMGSRESRGLRKYLRKNSNLLCCNADETLQGHRIESLLCNVRNPRIPNGAPWTPDNCFARTPNVSFWKEFRRRLIARSMRSQWFRGKLPVSNTISMENRHWLVILRQPVNGNAHLKTLIKTFIVAVIRIQLGNKPQLLWISCHQRASHDEWASGHDILVIRGAGIGQ